MLVDVRFGSWPCKNGLDLDRIDRRLRRTLEPQVEEVAEVEKPRAIAVE